MLRVLVLASLLTGPLTAHASAPTTPPPARAAGAVGAMVAAFRAGDAERVRLMGEAAGPLGVRLAIWELTRSGDVTDFSTYDSFLRGHPDWPALDQVRRQAERLLDAQPPQTVANFFAAEPPRTSAGAIALIDALEALGQDSDNALRAAWVDHDLTEEQEAALLARYGDRLAPLHPARLDALLWRGEREAAERMLPNVSPALQALAQARLALQRRVDGVDALVAAVPPALADDPGLAHDRFRWRLATGATEAAADLLAARAPEALGQPQVWAGQRARLARDAMREGRGQRAYDLAANHGLTDGVALADLEWLAGYVALRQLDRPDLALTHFQRLRDRVGSPISLGRAGYWEGRALEALGRADEARAAYEFGARYQTAFYGQLAAERIGQTLDPDLLRDPRYPDWTETALAHSELLQAALLLHSLGEWYEARRFLLHLAGQLQTEDDLGALAQLWMDRGEVHYALRIAKVAVERGILLPRAYFPLHPGLTEARLPVATELALAIARRESEFDHRVISHADARGLMQVLPSTARHTARRLGMDFDESRLTADPAFNAMLGAGYLDEMAGEFDGTLSLVAAAYNAGPGRPRRWITEFGDPRDAAIDPIDWVEMVPFTETRNYIMRVTESVVLYRAILAGQSGPIRLTDILRGRD